MWKKISLLQKNLVWSIPFFMLLGISYGYFYNASPLKAAIIPFTFLMVYPMMVTLNMKTVFVKGDTKLQFLVQSINFVLIPFFGFFVGKLFFPENPLIIIGLLLTSLLPTSGMTISWTGFAKGNIPAAIKMTVIGLILGSILTPFYLKFLMGAVIAIPLFDVFKQIVFIVFLPMIAGYLTQRFMIWKFGEAKYQKDFKPKFPALSTLGVLGIVFIAMALKSKTIVSNPSILVFFLVPLALLYGVNFLFSTIIGKFFLKREDGIALVYGTVMRNLSIALAIAMTVFGERGSEIALIIAMAYIIQVQAAAWYVRFTETIFGKAPEDTAADIMQEGIFSLSESSTLHEAIKLLDEEHIHSVAVLSNNDGALGLLTSEMIINMLADQTALDTKLGQLKLKPILTCKQKSPLSKVIQQMKRKHEYKVLLTDEKGKLAGILTESDILGKLSSA